MLKTVRLMSDLCLKPSKKPIGPENVAQSGEIPLRGENVTECCIFGRMAHNPGVSSGLFTIIL